MEQFTNAANSTLGTSITIGATTLSVASASGFPTLGNFRILVDSEIMLVTAVSGTTFTVTRAQESTTAVAHSSGANVTHIVTAGAMTAVRGDWQTVLDLDFTAQATQTLTTDTTYTIGGLTWTKFNSINEATHAQITNGTGLIFQPASTSDYNGGTRTFPGIYTPLSGILSSQLLDPSTRLRAYLYMSANNITNTYDSAVMAFDLGSSANYGVVIKNGFRSDGPQGCTQFWNIGGSNLGFQNDSFTTGTTATNVTVLELHRLGGHTFQGGFGQYSAGFPSPPGGTGIYWRSHVQDTGARHDVGWMGNISNLMLTIGAQRAGSGTSLSLTFARLRLDAQV